VRTGTDTDGLRSRVAQRLGAFGVRPGEAVVVGVSGGGDSVALLCVLRDLRPVLGLDLTAACLDHGLRGARGEADVSFVRGLCRQLDVALVEGRVSVAEEARRDGLSLEMAARRARRRFLEAVRQAVGARLVLLAHQADDQAETLLLRLGRGSGLLGAGAMAAVTPDGIARPLLGERREELRAYLEAIGQPWREDETNAEPAAERNRLRLSVLPAWEAAQPGVTERLARSAGQLREDGELLAAAVESLLPQPVRANGGPWRAIPWTLWRAAGAALRRQLLRQAAASLAGVYPPAAWTQAWSRWPEAREALPDLPWLRMARTARAAVAYRPAAAWALALPSAAAWRLELPGGAVLESLPADHAGKGALRLGAGAAVRHPLPGECVPEGGGQRPVRDVLRARGVPAPCRAAAWMVVGGAAPWLPDGELARRPAQLADGSAVDLVWRAPPLWGQPGGWPACRS
jgi:tRNA(Ile)-lysidine synthetase-like protein